MNFSDINIKGNNTHHDRINHCQSHRNKRESNLNPHSKDRIITPENCEGYEVIDGQFPWHVHLEFPGGENAGIWCGGSLVTMDVSFLLYSSVM